MMIIMALFSTQYRSFRIPHLSARGVMSGSYKWQALLVFQGEESNLILEHTIIPADVIIMNLFFQPRNHHLTATKYQCVAWFWEDVVSGCNDKIMKLLTCLD